MTSTGFSYPSGPPLLTHPDHPLVLLCSSSTGCASLVYFIRSGYGVGNDLDGMDGGRERSLIRMVFDLGTGWLPQFLNTACAGHPNMCPRADGDSQKTHRVVGGGGPQALSPPTSLSVQPCPAPSLTASLTSAVTSVV
eukprot:EG_transcript_23418